MKIIGLIGGMSWESTAIYYRMINEMTRDELGGLHSAKILLWSFDFDAIARLQSIGDWAGATQCMINAGLALKAGGAEALVICTNTMHKMAEEVEQGSGLPVLHIADATATAIKHAGLKNVGLLATRFTMEQDFYTGRLRAKHGLNPIIPQDDDRAEVHRIIYDELCKGIITPDSKQRYLKIVDRLIARGAEGIIFGCTEVGMLLQQADISVPAFDSTHLHAAAAVEWSVR